MDDLICYVVMQLLYLKLQYNLHVEYNNNRT